MAAPYREISQSATRSPASKMVEDILTAKQGYSSLPPNRPPPQETTEPADTYIDSCPVLTHSHPRP